MIAYKYRGGPTFQRDLDSIAGDYFYASTIDGLNDPFEATYTYGPLEEFMKLMEFLAGSPDATAQIRSGLEKIFEQIKGVGVFSLSQRYDDFKLWSHYTQRHSGFCVGYDVDKLSKFNGDVCHKHHVIEVQYSLTPEALAFEDVKNVGRFLQKAIGVKHPDWAHEAETRIVTDKAGAMPHDFRAVKAIYFGLYMPQEQVEQVMERLQGRQIAYYRMQRSATAYELMAVPVADPFTQALRYLYHVLPEPENALDTYAEGAEKEALLPYLRMAVEIQRRDPYCTAVNYAERCLDTKTGDVYVSYQYNDQYYNRYFTKPEIEQQYAQLSDLEA